MIAHLLVAAAAFATAGPKADLPAGETTIPRMSRFLEWRPDGNQALFIRGDTGRWYRVTLETPCPRIQNRSNTRFDASPSNRFDRFSSINADGWRCQVESIARSEGPPRRRR